MKKTKILLPAMGLIAFATAASVVGSVAWFTASQAYQMQAASFAVVNTKDNLEAILDEGLGTDLDGEVANKIKVESNKVLTDGSFDHTNISKENTIIAPDAAGVNVDKVIPLSSAIIGTEVSDAYGLIREKAGAETPAVYTAFTWQATFKLSFSSSAAKKVGLFLDLASNKTYMHEAYKATAADVSSKPEGTWFTDEACTVALGETAMASGTTYYKAAPDNTGNGFRVAIVPVSVPENSMGYTKIWAEHNTDENLSFIDISKTADYPEYDASSSYNQDDLVRYQDKLYKCTADSAVTGAWDNTKWALDTVTLASKKETIASATSSLTSNGSGDPVIAAATGLAGMKSGDNTAVPEAGAVSSTTALSTKSNFLGYFAPVAGSTVALTYKFVAYYEGTDSMIKNDEHTIYETMVLGMDFGLATLSD